MHSAWQSECSLGIRILDGRDWCVEGHEEIDRIQGGLMVVPVVY